MEEQEAENQRLQAEIRKVSAHLDRLNDLHHAHKDAEARVRVEREHALAEQRLVELHAAHERSTRSLHRQQPNRVRDVDDFRRRIENLEKAVHLVEAGTPELAEELEKRIGQMRQELRDQIRRQEEHDRAHRHDAHEHDREFNEIRHDAEDHGRDRGQAHFEMLNHSIQQLREEVRALRQEVRELHKSLKH
jgi:prefoldin subunit 5